MSRKIGAFAATEPAAPEDLPPPEPARGLHNYVTLAPSPQNAVDLFAGTWSSAFPAPLDQVVTGGVPLFADDRVTWAIEQLGGIDGLRVLELGPLEGGHTYMMTAAGAEVVAIEAQARAYLKCLVAKELLGMENARFLLGDFMEYLRETDDHYDVCFASGVLYHMRNPAETLQLAAKVADNLVLWTHIYDEAIVSANPALAVKFPTHEALTYEGFACTLHRQEYLQALQAEGFCGGTAIYSNWLTREDLFGALEHFGWTVTGVAFDTPDHVNGPALALTATRSK